MPPQSASPANHTAGNRAAAKATDKNSTRVVIPGIGPVRLPAPPQLAYVGGIAALAALQVIEWPIGLALAAGHPLATGSHDKVVEDFGAALEEA